MSVILFGSEELASVACALVGTAMCPVPEVVSEYAAAADRLAKFSQSNTRAFNATYGESWKAVTATEILAAVKNGGVAMHARARDGASGWARLAKYNLVTNGGKDYATRADLALICDVYGATVPR